MQRLLTAALVAVSLAGSAAAESVIGDDGLQKADRMRDTFKDLREDLDEANAEGKRMFLIVEQRGCIYCSEMHEKVLSQPEIADFIQENFFVVQLNLHGDVEVTDFDGETLAEKAMARKWGLLFTPTIIFLPDEVTEGVAAPQAAVAVMPGAFGAEAVYNLFT